jgi:myo-inositol-1(or 4)-monophosphatase
MSSYLKIAVEAAKIAGKIQQRHYGRVKHIQFKSSSINLVTEVDKACEKAVLGHLKKRFPTYGLWGEESGQEQKQSEYTWIVDPLDGTTNYAHAYPFFCVSIALLKGLQPVAGVVYDALRDECFTAEKNRGAAMNGKKIRVSNIPTLEKSLLSTGFSYGVRETRYNLDNFTKMVLTAQGVRRDGSAALNLTYVAAGRMDGFWERYIEAWDMAAGVLLVQEAGGRVTDITGKPFDLLGKNALATNGKIHKALFDFLKKGSDEKKWAQSHLRGGSRS